MTISIPVRAVVSRPRIYEESRFRFAVMGLLAVTGDHCILIDDREAVNIIGRTVEGKTFQPDSDDTTIPHADADIIISDPQFLPWLTSQIPSLHDSEYLYFDRAMMTGRIRFDSGKVLLHEVWDVSLVRDRTILHATVAPTFTEPSP